MTTRNLPTCLTCPVRFVELPIPALEVDRSCCLTLRELEILRLVGGGRENWQIAQALKVCDHTIKNRLTAIYKKLDVPDRTSAVVRALKLGWIELWELEC